MNFIKFWDFSDFSEFHKILILKSFGNERHNTYQLFANNYSSFVLRWKVNLLNYQKVSKYYEHDCLEIFLLVFISLLTGLIVESSNTSTRIYFIFLKSILNQAWKASIPNLNLNQKVGEVVMRKDKF